MKIAIISPAYIPQTTSCAVQIADLAKEFVTLGHEVIVLTPSRNLAEGGVMETIEQVVVYRLAALKIENTNLFKRTISEMLLPFTMILSVFRTGLSLKDFDGVIWYSPSIFLGPLAWYIKFASKSKGYLILRDIFPEWAADLAIIKKGITYYFFKLVAGFQYSIADTIGVQSISNLVYFTNWRKPSRRIEVLSNWLAPSKNPSKLNNIDLTKLSGRKLFVYVGNMGIAQGMQILVDLAEFLKDRSDLGFVFVGRGSEKLKLIQRSQALGLNNILFHDEIPSGEIPTLLSLCDVGLLALDPKHNSHNIPGKFLAYVESRLPVLARLNSDTDLSKIILKYKIGASYTGYSIEDFADMAINLIDADDDKLAEISIHCSELYNSEYLPSKAAVQILTCFELNHRRPKSKGSVV